MIRIIFLTIFFQHLPAMCVMFVAKHSTCVKTCALTSCIATVMPDPSTVRCVHVPSKPKICCCATATRFTPVSANSSVMVRGHSWPLSWLGVDQLDPHPSSILHRHWINWVIPVYREWLYVFVPVHMAPPPIPGVTLCFCTGSYAAAHAAAGRRLLSTR